MVNYLVKSVLRISRILGYMHARLTQIMNAQSDLTNN
jgi:hypothetical protein